MKFTKITKYVYNDMLEVLPPAAYTHGRLAGGETFSCFLVGEPANHNRQGEALYSSYFTCNDEYFAGEQMTETQLYDFANTPDKVADAINNYEDSEDEKIVDMLEAIEYHGEEIVEAYAECFGWEYTTKDAIDDSYSGKYDSDEEFAQEMAEQLGDINKDINWPHSCIDWERVARELMYDYCEHNGYYFRNC